jgi:hypothetical protein
MNRDFLNYVADLLPSVCKCIIYDGWKRALTKALNLKILESCVCGYGGRVDGKSPTIVQSPAILE